jgi:class 3 adenylate cyclase
MSNSPYDSYSLPDDPDLATVARAVRDTGQWSWIVDPQWRCVYVTDELRRSNGADERLMPVAMGEHLYGTAAVNAAERWVVGANSAELYRSFFNGVVGMILADTPGGREELKTLVDPRLADLVDAAAPTDDVAISFMQYGAGVAEVLEFKSIAMRVFRPTGERAGTVLISKPSVGMDTIATTLFNSDIRHIEAMRRVRRAARRPSAVLFADLEGSSSLAKRLPTASYFTLGRRLVRAADRCVIDAGGIVGRHIGDGVVAFFPDEIYGSESAAAHACIRASQALAVSVAEVAARSELPTNEVIMRFGLHWGSAIYLGGITTGGRDEVTALGDDVNDAARIEACATGGRILASKNLIERLTIEDAAEFGLDPNRLTYTMLGDLATATEKARQDAPAMAVCDVSSTTTSQKTNESG